jgi:hypothetical protein
MSRTAHQRSDRRSNRAANFIADDRAIQQRISAAHRLDDLRGSQRTSRLRESHPNLIRDVSHISDGPFIDTAGLVAKSDYVQPATIMACCESLTDYDW